MSITIIIVTQTPTHVPLLEPSLCQARCMAPKYRDVRNLFSLYGVFISLFVLGRFFKLSFRENPIIYALSKDRAW